MEREIEIEIEIEREIEKKRENATCFKDLHFAMVISFDRRRILEIDDVFSTKNPKTKKITKKTKYNKMKNKIKTIKSKNT